MLNPKCRLRRQDIICPAQPGAVYLHSLQQPCQSLLPGQGVHVLLRVYDPDLRLQFRNDGSSPPAMTQHEVLEVRVKKQPRIQHKD